MFTIITLIMKINSLKLTFISILMSGFLLNCKPSNQQRVLPSCIDSKIEAIKKAPVQNPPTEIWKWQIDTVAYYYITSGCCDQYNYLYNENCEVVCAPDGGFTGKGDQKCPDFGDNIQKKLIWKDERKQD